MSSLVRTSEAPSKNTAQPLITQSADRQRMSKKPGNDVASWLILFQNSDAGLLVFTTANKPMMQRTSTNTSAGRRTLATPFPTRKGCPSRAATIVKSDERVAGSRHIYRAVPRRTNGDRALGTDPFGEAVTPVWPDRRALRLAHVVPAVGGANPELFLGTFGA
jgi:hypothetical protein